MPQLQDPNFARTVVLLCDFTPDGAFGLVINRPTDMPATSMVRLDPPIDTGNDLRLWIGGPVEPQRGWMLLGEAPETEFKTIRDGLYLSTSPDSSGTCSRHDQPRGPACWPVMPAGDRGSSTRSSPSPRGSSETSISISIFDVDSLDPCGRPRSAALARIRRRSPQDMGCTRALSG